MLPRHHALRLPECVDRTVQRQPAVRQHRLAGHPTHTENRHHGFGHVVSLAEAAQRGPFGQPLDPPGSCSGLASIGVRVTPGPTALTRMPYCPHSAAATRTSMSTPALDTQ